MSPAGFEPTISAGERQQIYAVERAATGIGFLKDYSVLISNRHKDGVNRPGETQFESQHAISDVTSWFSRRIKQSVVA